MDKEFIDFLDKKFNKIDEKFAEAKGDAEETRRHFDVAAESLRSDLRLIAEGHGLLQDQIENLRKETKDEIRNVRQEIETLRKEFIEHRRDNEKSFKDLLAAIKFSYADLDHRMTSLEAELQALRVRIERLEAQK